MYQVGEVLSIPHGFYRHYMVVVGYDQVVHASKELKVVVSERLGDVFVGKKIKSHGRWGQLTDAEVVRRAKNEVGQPYSLTSWNCEHVVRKITGLKELSPQITTAIAVLLGLGVMWWVQSRARVV